MLQPGELVPSPWACCAHTAPHRQPVRCALKSELTPHPAKGHGFTPPKNHSQGKTLPEKPLLQHCLLGLGTKKPNNEPNPPRFAPFPLGAQHSSSKASFGVGGSRLVPLPRNPTQWPLGGKEKPPRPLPLQEGAPSHQTWDRGERPAGSHLRRAGGGKPSRHL